MAFNELFQFSIVSALMDGVASTGIPISTILEHGDHGLGTFRNLMGEMIILDGTVYQMRSDGSVLSLATAPDTITPFAAVTRFQPTVTKKVALSSKQALFDELTHMLPSAHNHFLAVRVDGTFRSVTVRTVGGQTVPHERLADVGKHQTSHTFAGTGDGAVRGTVIGFRSPPYMQGVSVAGDHLHLITADRQRGGHLLALETEGEVEVMAAPIWRLHLELPRGDDEFNEATLERDSKGIAAVEG